MVRRAYLYAVSALWCTWHVPAVRQKPTSADSQSHAQDLASAASSVESQLPAVDSVLEQASDTLTDFVKHTAAMQAQVAKADQEARTLLSRQKANFETNLTEESRRNTEIFQANDRIREHIVKLEKDNSALRNHTTTIRKGNDLLHDAFGILEPKMRMAELFLEDSLRQTNTTGSEELQILAPKAPEPTLKYFMDVAASDITIHHSTSGHHSLLQIDPKWPLSIPKATKRTTDDLVKDLSNRLGDLASASAEGEAQLQAHFLVSHELSMKHRTELVDDQASLNATKHEQAKLSGDLEAAKAHLLYTKNQLQSRLEAVQSFTLNVDDIVADALDASDAAVKMS